MPGMAAGNTTNLSRLQCGYPTQGAVSFALVPANQQVLLHSFSVFNGTASAADLGLGIDLPQSANQLKFFSHGASDTDVTSALIAGTATNIFDTTNNHGFIVECADQFGFLNITVSQPETGSPVYVYEYWNGASWATLATTLQVPAAYAASQAAGQAYIAFAPPADWVTGDGGASAFNFYSVRVRATTAPGQAVKATKIVVGKWIAYRTQVTAYGSLQVVFDFHPILLKSGEALQPFFGSAANGNMVEAAYQIAP